SGVIPVIFASSLLTFPLQLAQGFGSGAKWVRDLSFILRPDGWLHLTLYVLLIVFFAYFYTQVSLNPQEISKNIRENGGSIPGIRSERMEEYLTRILNRIVLPGALYLAFIALIPTLIQQWFNFPAELSYLLGGTSLLILVGVDLDTMSQIEAQLKMHHHDGLTKKGHIKSRNL
ncbi:MAG: preprotein translocase subunit SecY, partial [Spirochaetes bacterium]|nr:preprotein translocase subunit SecY [Spirochaetota bacterium]